MITCVIPIGFRGKSYPFSFTAFTTNSNVPAYTTNINFIVQKRLSNLDLSTTTIYRFPQWFLHLRSPEYSHEHAGWVGDGSGALLVITTFRLRDLNVTDCIRYKATCYAGLNMRVGHAI